MATTTSIMGDRHQIMMKKVVNYLMQLFSQEHHWAYRREYLKYAEDSLRIWEAVQPRKCVYLEIDDPSSDTAYEKAEISLDYFADPNEEVVKPPVAHLEAPLARLTTLPDRWWLLTTALP